MLAELRSRVKLHRTLGAADALASILTEANDYVFDQLDDGLPWHSTITVAANAQYIPFVSDAGLPIARGSVAASGWMPAACASSCRKASPRLQRGIPLRARPTATTPRSPIRMPARRCSSSSCGRCPRRPTRCT
jgi:hypothetical protein